MLAVFLDSLQLAATERVDNRVEAGFTEVLERMNGFEDMRRAVLDIATQARAAQRLGSVSALDSQLSLSTYAGDDKNGWRRFRTKMISIGFRSDSLDRHMEVLQAYMMRLDQSGGLDEAAIQSASHRPPWWANDSFRLTNISLPAQERACLISPRRTKRMSQLRNFISGHCARPQMFPERICTSKGACLRSFQERSCPRNMIPETLFIRNLNSRLPLLKSRVSYLRSARMSHLILMFLWAQTQTRLRTSCLRVTSQNIKYLNGTPSI